MAKTIETWTGHTFYHHWTDNPFRLGDHEIAMSFTNDVGAAAFIEWWEGDGQKAFESHCETLQCDEVNHP